MSDTTRQDAVEKKGTRKLGRLFKVLVVGGAVIAAAYASAIQGGTGSASAGADDGGTQGW
jgi:hypothetical protein